MNVLVVDVGGSHVKVALAGSDLRAQFDSGPELSPEAMMGQVREATAGWEYEAVSIGYPGRMAGDRPAAEPGNLGNGWVGFDFSAAFGKPVRIVNDAVLQALGAYRGHRMLFIGLGTGVGSALVTEHVAVPLELGDLPDGPARTLVDSLGREGLERLGLEQWQDVVLAIVPALRRAFIADYIVLGGGNSARLEHLPEATHCGGNDDAIEGGRRLWEQIVEPHDRQPAAVWRVVQ